MIGLIIGLGTSRFYLFAFALVLLYIILRYRQRVTIPIEIWGIVLCVGGSSIWAIYPGKAIIMCVAILCAYLTYMTFPRNHLRKGIYIVLAINIVVVSYQIINGGLRPYGLAYNASMLGLSSMWMAPLYPMAILGGLSMSRTAVLGAVIFGLTGRRYAIFAGVLISVSFITTLVIYPDRLTFNDLHNNADLRVATINGTSTEPHPVDLPAPDVVELPVIPIRGYGFGNYSFHTGKIQPHNIFVRTWYELGILSIPLFGFLLSLWWKSRDWRFLAVAVATGMLTDELLGSVAGVYMILGYAIMSESVRRQLSKIASVDAVNQESPVFTDALSQSNSPQSLRT